MGETQTKQFCICNSASAPKRRTNTLSLSSSPESCSKAALIHPKKQKKVIKYSFERDFKLLKKISEGSYGSIYLVLHNQSNQQYAVKQINKNIKLKNTEHAIKENIFKEKKILKNISHPFIIKLHFTFQDEDSLYLVMDYMNGGDLSTVIHNEKFLNEDTVKFYLAEVYLAIKYLHSKNIIHRDIKSENILLDSNGHIKLIDFGLDKKGIDHCNLTSSFIGTAECIPPEVLLHQSYGFNFDWWSFGILMYEMIYGFPPFRDFYQGGIFHLILNTEPLYYKLHPGSTNRKKIKVSNEAIDLMKALLNKNPEMRINPDEIPKHPFFCDVDFDKISKQEVEVPYLPIEREYERDDLKL